MSLTPERWRAVEAIVGTLAERPAAERVPLIEAACGSDAALRREVESLLAAHDGAGDFLDPAPLARGGVELEVRPGATLNGRYTLDRVVGHGGMASVYLALDRKHDRQVAVKVLLPELSATIGSERFAREIHLVARLQHPHLLPLFDSGEMDGLLYFVMPFVDGESLRARLDRHGALALGETVRLVRQIADALDYAHARGVVHRDVKPENILLAEGQALLADFGIARPATATVGGTLTSIGVTLGTPAYMSPEQAAADAHVDHRSDVYSLGCVAYEMLAGAPPFRASSAAALMAQHVLREPPPLVGAREALPAAAGGAVSRALTKDPVERLGTAGELAAALEAALVGAHASSPTDQRIREVERRHAARQRVLVLEYANITAAPDVEWLSTGIAETLGADLGKVAGIKVVGQDAATRRRVEAARQGRLVDAGQALTIAREEGARWVVWGAFQKQGTRIRLTTHLAGTLEGAALHETKVDGAMDDVFALQDRIVADLVEALGVELTSADAARIREPETKHLSAYEHYARGYQAYYRFGKESIRTAIAHFRDAIAIDPGYALAHAGLGVVHGPLYIATGRREVLDEGVAHLERALALDPSIGEAYAWLAYMQARQERFDDAERTARAGVEREPGSFMGWYMLGIRHYAHAVTRGRPADLARAVPPLLRAIALNGSFEAAHGALGAIYLLRGEYGHAGPLLDRAAAVERSGAGMQFVGALAQRAVVHLGSGDTSRAAPLLDEAVARYAQADHVYAETMHAYARWAQGCLSERSAVPELAAERFGDACAVADAHPHRIGIGAHWVKARFGLARALHRVGRTDDALERLHEGRDLFTARARFVWTFFAGCSDADVWYELAATLAALGRVGEVGPALARAVDAGWADCTWLRHDPSFEHLRDAPVIGRLCREGASRVTLPPPVGSGGLA